MKNFGDFSADGLEYVTTTPHTPRDWFNFLWNPTYLACAGNSMNGCSLYQNEIRRGRTPALLVDGVPATDDFVPMPAQGLGPKTIHIECTIPAAARARTEEPAP